MPSDTVTAFAELDKEQEILPPGELDRLLQQPDCPQDDLGALCEYLIAGGHLTAYQAERIRTRRWQELKLGPFSILDKLQPSPTGPRFRAKRGPDSPLELTRIECAEPARWHDHFERIKQVQHPGLQRVLAVESHNNSLLVGQELLDGANLQTLITDIGPMPAVLAVEFTRQAARGLEVAHEHGVLHGDVRPSTLQIGPLVPMAKPRPDGTPRFRPAPTAVLKVGDLGLASLAPPPSHLPDDATTRDRLAYLPPEQLENPEPTPAGDVSMLASTLYFLLTSRAPYSATTMPELLERKRSSEPPSLATLRPDLAPELVALLQKALSREPAQRPSMADFAEQLQNLGKGGATPLPEPAPAAVSVAAAPSSEDGADVELASVDPIPDSSDGALASLSGVNLDAPPPPVLDPVFVAPPIPWPAVAPYPARAYAAAGHGWEGDPAPAGLPLAEPAESGSPRTPRRPSSSMSRTKLFLWIVVGLLLQLIAIGIWVVMIYEPWKPDEPDESPPAQTAPTKPKPGKKKSDTV